MISAEQRGNVSDPLDQCRVGRRANLRDHRFPRFTIFGVDSNFDQFMMVKSQQDFMDDRWRDAVIADDHDRLAVMGQGFEVTLLRIGQDGHGISGYGERFQQCNRR